MAWPGTILTIKIIKEIKLVVPSRQSVPVNNLGTAVAWGSLGLTGYSQAGGTGLVTSTWGTEYLTPSLSPWLQLIALCHGDQGRRTQGTLGQKLKQFSQKYWFIWISILNSAEFKSFIIMPQWNYSRRATRTTNRHPSAPGSIGSPRGKLRARWWRWGIPADHTGHPTST